MFKYAIFTTQECIVNVCIACIVIYEINMNYTSCKYFMMNLCRKSIANIKTPFCLHTLNITVLYAYLIKGIQYLLSSMTIGLTEVTNA